MFKPKNHFLTITIAIISSLLIFSSNSILAHEKSNTIAQQNPSTIEIKTTAVRDNIYMLEGEGGNIGLFVGNEGVMMIDSQFANISEKIKLAIKEINQKPVRYLVNTHYHFDHVGGNQNFAEDGTVIIAHDNVIKQMKIPHSYPVLGMKTEASPSNALPQVTFNDKTNFHLNGSHVHTLHIPLAHTDGDIIVHFPQQNILHTGDLFFNGFYPFIDTSVGGSVSGMIKAIDTILPLCNDQTLIIPGHGKLSNRQELITFQEMLKTVEERVKNAMMKNMSLDDMIKGELLADLDNTWGDGFLTSSQFLTIAYEGMKN